MPFIFPWSSPLYAVSVFFLGACIGSFLNVVIYRLPRGMSVNEPKRSFCPKCKVEIPMWRNIPLVTWLLQRGKCASCGEGIAFRYFAVELLTALVWVGCWYCFDDPMQSIFYMFIATILIAVTVIDAELMVIPRELTILGTVLGVAAGGLMPWHFGETIWYYGVLKSLLGFALGWCGLWAMVLLGKVMFGKLEFKFEEATRWMLKEPESDDEELCFVVGEESLGWSDVFFRKSDRIILEGVSDLRVDGELREVKSLEIHGEYILVDGEKIEIDDLKSLDGVVMRAVVPREAMGMGDVDLLGMIGACLGPFSLLIVVFGACIFSLLWALVCRLGLGKHMPFGPSLVAGAVIWVFWGSQLWNWYMERMGI